MQIEEQTVVVTGANRGLGRSLVEALLDHGAAKVYAAARTPSAVSNHPRVVPVALDLLDRETIAAAARQAGDTTVLINNASTASFATPLDADPATVRQEMVVNFDGTFDVIRAFVPVLERNGGGAIVNVLSLLSLASTPPMAGYSASKAAAHSLTQALRPVLDDQEHHRPRRLPGRNRHRHAGRDRRAQDAGPASRRRRPRRPRRRAGGHLPRPERAGDGGDLVVGSQDVRTRLQRGVSAGDGKLARNARNTAPPAVTLGGPERLGSVWRPTQCTASELVDP